MTLTVLDQPIAEVSQLMAADLSVIELELEKASDELKRRKDVFNAVLARRFNDAAQAALVASGRDTGTTSIEVGNGITVKATFSKKVTWDQTKLMAALETLPHADAKHYAKVDIKIDERKFTAAPPAIQALFAPARTVKAEKAKLSFKVEEAEAA